MADLEATSNDELLRACRTGDWLKLKSLFSTHEYTTSTKKTALQEAAAKGHENIVQFLLSTEPAIEVDSYTAHKAAWGGLGVYRLLHRKHPDIIQWSFGESGDVVNCAVHTNNTLLLKYVLDNGADPGRTSVCYRYVNRFSPIEGTALVSDDPEIAKVLLKHGATLEHTEALDIAALLGRLKLINYLLDVGAAVNYIRGPTDLMYDPCQTYGSLLHTAVGSSHTEIIEVLLRHGADPLIEDTAGKTAWYEAQTNGYKEAIRLFQLYAATDEDQAKRKRVNET